MECLAAIPSLVMRLEQNNDTVNLNQAERCTMRIEEYLQLLRVLIGRMEDVQRSLLGLTAHNECDQLLQDLQALMVLLHEYLQHYLDLTMKLEDEVCNLEANLYISCLVIRDGHVGRPPLLLSPAQIETLIDFGYSYTRIARMFGVCERTLLRRRIEYGLPVGRPFTQISDSDLDDVIRGILQVSYRGQILKWLLD